MVERAKTVSQSFYTFIVHVSLGILEVQYDIQNLRFYYFFFSIEKKNGIYNVKIYCIAIITNYYYAYLKTVLNNTYNFIFQITKNY